MGKTEYDAIVVGSGPNGLAAAITLQQAGCSVLLIEGKDTLGGGMRSEALTLPGFTHDVCSAIHPLAIASPFFCKLPLEKHGLRYILPDIAAAHPLEDGSEAFLDMSLDVTARALRRDEHVYRHLIKPVADTWPHLAEDVLGPLTIPRHPVAMARFGVNALRSANAIARRFSTPQGKGLWAGMAAHGIQPLSNLSSAAIGLVLMANAHIKGWPVPVGGSQSIANALVSYFKSLGGTIQTEFFVSNLGDLPSAKAVLLDVTPRQLLQIAGHTFSSFYTWQLQRYRYGMGVFKVDWALNGPVPFTAPACRIAGTVHLGNTFEEIARSEYETSTGRHADKPFVLLAQQSIFDPTRAPAGHHTAWAYCHVPHGSTRDMTEAIEKQVERFAPGFRDRIIARHTMNTLQMQEHNPNYIGGDINGGVIDLGQLFTRPALRFSPYRTSAKGIYICSSSTPPGGGVHGMCGFHAARRALNDIFRHTFFSIR
ncbi:phytoene desaturase family protein [Dawidia soli]|uniref:NAD(P)/FAD-dependent oxidoreductase n=1 Tax=Dawidia soli TaxID=2782352 RepID=A0AAP2GGH4_9BACT|nr:NAD(P)/FAD-dependent oxidoreductase [Dawidia soli]MBT1685013.1 NAD(P)/FAD-dependent oxidoreductase [Dawidia soli]